MLILAFLLLAFGAAYVYVRICGFVVWKTALLFAGCFLALNLLYFVVVWVATWFINQSKPISRQNSVCRTGCMYVAYLLTGYAWVRTHVRGLEKLPEPGKFLLVCNHRSMFDPAVIVRKLGKFNISFVSKPSNMKIPLFGTMGYGAGYLAIDRENDRKHPAAQRQQHQQRVGGAHHHASLHHQQDQVLCRRPRRPVEISYGSHETIN